MNQCQDWFFARWVHSVFLELCPFSELFFVVTMDKSLRECVFNLKWKNVIVYLNKFVKQAEKGKNAHFIKLSSRKTSFKLRRAAKKRQYSSELLLSFKVIVSPRESKIGEGCAAQINLYFKHSGLSFSWIPCRIANQNSIPFSFTVVTHFPTHIKIYQFGLTNVESCL